MNRKQIITELTKLFENAPFSWTVCGGYALDLFLDQDTRTHGDIDICLLEQDRTAALQHMLNHGWQVYEFRGQGKVRPLNHAAVSEAGHNLMCVKDDCDLVKFYPCEEEGIFYHQFFHTGLQKLNYLEFLFSTADGAQLLINQQAKLQRELSKAFLVKDDIPYLAPEIALLYKASDADRAENQQDFQVTYPHLNSEQQAWFGHVLKALYPSGHPWL